MTSKPRLTGKLGSLGQPVLRSKAKEMERQFAARLAAAFAAPARDRAVTGKSFRLTRCSAKLAIRTRRDRDSEQGQTAGSEQPRREHRGRTT